MLTLNLSRYYYDEFGAQVQEDEAARISEIKSFSDNLKRKL